MSSESLSQGRIRRLFQWVLLAGWSLAILFVTGTLYISSLSPQAQANAPEPSESLEKLRKDPHRVLGVGKADCKKCHPSEVAAWMKTMHYQTADMRLRNFTGNTKKYAEALGISQADLMKDSVCADCHGTKSVVNGEIRVISGVSCESCHGASGGVDGWLNPHQSYHASKTIPRDQETPEHRKARFDACEKAGKIHTKDISGLASNCYGCHVINNEKLIAAGHKAASAFEFVSWSEGEIKHNFHLDKTKNADAPTLWLDETKSTPENRRRMKFVLGAMAQLEATLRKRAEFSNAAVIPQVGGIAAAANGKIAQINGVAGTEETKEVAKIMTSLLGVLFVPQPTDKKTYTEAADQIAVQAERFSRTHDGSKLSALDTIIKATPPHYSGQYKKNYQGN